jgi:hypothetical protein
MACKWLCVPRASAVQIFIITLVALAGRFSSLNLWYWVMSWRVKSYQYSLRIVRHR